MGIVLVTCGLLTNIKVAQWQYQLEYFSQTAHVLAIDLLGCGKSELSYE